MIGIGVVILSAVVYPNPKIMNGTGWYVYEGRIYLFMKFQNLFIYFEFWSVYVSSG